VLLSRDDADHTDLRSTRFVWSADIFLCPAFAG